MSVSYRRFFTIDQGLIPGFCNFLINGGIAWWLNKELLEMPLWGEKSIVVDTVATAFLLPLITCLIVTPIVTGKVCKGSLKPVENIDRLDNQLPSFARSIFVRSVMAGLLGILCAASPVLIVWHIFGPLSVSIEFFLWFKAGFAALLGAFITALIAWWALVDASQRLLNESESRLQEVKL